MLWLKKSYSGNIKFQGKITSLFNFFKIIYFLQKIPEKLSSDILLLHLINTVVKYSERISVLEYRMKTLEGKHAEEIQELEQKLQMQQEKHDKELKKYVDDVEKIKSDYASEKGILKFN